MLQYTNKQINDLTLRGLNRWLVLFHLFLWLYDYRGGHLDLSHTALDRHGDGVGQGVGHRYGVGEALSDSRGQLDRRYHVRFRRAEQQLVKLVLSGVVIGESDL